MIQQLGGRRIEDLSPLDLKAELLKVATFCLSPLFNGIRMCTYWCQLQHLTHDATHLWFYQLVQFI